MTREQFKKIAIAKGWKEDSYGHLKATNAGGSLYRLKIQKLAWRLEKKIDFNPSYPGAKTSEWLRLKSGYYAKTEETGPSMHRVPELP